MDGFIEGDEINEIFQNNSEGISKSKVTSKPSLFTCGLCNFQSKFKTGLKSHKTKVHSQTFVSHFKCGNCEHTSTSEADLELHMTVTHNKNKRGQGNISPSSSPPHKKQEICLDINDHSSEDVISGNIRTEEDDKISKKNIEELMIMSMQKQIKELEEKMTILESKGFLNVSSEFKLPPHLSQVHEKHLSKLRGYKMRYLVRPDGACFDTAIATHIFEDPDESTKLRKMLNMHIIDHYDSYYSDALGLQ